MQRSHISEPLELDVDDILWPSCEIDKLSLNDFCTAWEQIIPERTLKASDTRNFIKRKIMTLTVV